VLLGVQPARVALEMLGQHQRPHRGPQAYRASAAVDDMQAQRQRRYMVAELGQRTFKPFVIGRSNGALEVTTPLAEHLARIVGKAQERETPHIAGCIRVISVEFEDIRAVR